MTVREYSKEKLRNSFENNIIKIYVIKISIFISSIYIIDDYKLLISIENKIHTSTAY